MRLRTVAACLLISSRVFAQPTSDTSTADAARALYAEGKDLREAGDLNKSLEKLEAAHALYATPITALEVGRARALVGKMRAAIEVLESIERLPVKPNESAKASSAREEAKTLLAQYRARIPKLLLHVQGPDVHVWVDGEVVPNDALASPWLVDAGTHHVEAASGEHRTSQDVRLSEGESRDVTLFQNATMAAPPSPNVLAYVGFGVGAVGIAAGAVTGIITLSRASDIKQQCHGGICPSSAGLESAQTLGTVSTISFIVGGVGAGVGVAALLFAGDRHDSRKRQALWVEPSITGSTVGVRGGF